MKNIKTRLLLILLTICALYLSACKADSANVTTIVVNFPYGEWALVVQREGDGRLYYGELLGQPVKGEAFDIDELYDQLRTRIHEVVPAEARPVDQPYGMVIFGFRDGSSMDYFIYDGAFAEKLFDIARQNLIEPFP